MFTRLSGLSPSLPLSSPTGMRVLAGALPTLSALDLLAVRGNDLGDEAAAEFAPGLEALVQLRTLDLSDNRL